jgi:hypothetical protein
MPTGMMSIKFKNFLKFMAGTFNEIVISKYPSRAIIQTDQLKVYL